MGEFTTQQFHFADFTLDQTSYRLQRGERILRLEKRPMELLILLVERRGELVSREEIAERLWGKDVFLDLDRSINTAVSKVRVALRDDPEHPRFVETVVGKGYRFAAPVSGNGDSSPQVEPSPLPLQVSSNPGVQPASIRATSKRLKLLFAVVPMLALLTVGWVVRHRGGATATRLPSIKSLAVLPLKNLSGDPSQEYFADGMTEAIISRLSSIHDLRVISRTTVMQFKDTRLSAPEIAKKLQVDALVEGSVMRQGAHVRVHAQLIRGATDEHFWSEEYDRDVGDTFALESDVAQSVARKVNVTITGRENERLVAARHVAPEVYESYLRAQFIRSHKKSEIERKIAYLQDAINKDSTFAPAYLALADADADLGATFVGGPADEVRPKAMSAARKALQLDPQLSEAHDLLADLYQDQWHWAEAEREYKTALDLNPNDAVAHAGLANWLLCQGRIEEALTWAQRARDLDPLGMSGVQRGWILFSAHRYDEALRDLRSVLAVRPDYDLAVWSLGVALTGNHEYEAAIPVLERAVAMMERSPATIESLATAYAYAGRRTKALRLINELKQGRQTGYVSADTLIEPYLALGDRDEAFAWFERACQEKSERLQYLKVDPLLDPVRGDPRFVHLLHCVGLDR